MSSWMAAVTSAVTLPANSKRKFSRTNQVGRNTDGLQADATTFHFSAGSNTPRRQFFFVGCACDLMICSCSPKPLMYSQPHRVFGYPRKLPGTSEPGGKDHLFPTRLARVPARSDTEAVL